MNATCRQLEFVGSSQGKELAKGIDQRRAVQFFPACSAISSNGAQESDSLHGRWWFGVQPSDDARQVWCAILGRSWCTRCWQPQA